MLAHQERSVLWAPWRPLLLRGLLRAPLQSQRGGRAAAPKHQIHAGVGSQINRTTQSKEAAFSISKHLTAGNAFSDACPGSKCAMRNKGHCAQHVMNSTCALASLSGSSAPMQTELDYGIVVHGEDFR